MKIREIIERSKNESLPSIAKIHLSIGKDKAREALKEAGCYSKNGLRGWYFDGDESVLDQSIYEYVIPTGKPNDGVSTAKKEASATIEEPRLKNDPTFQQSKKTESKKTNKSTKKQINKKVGKPTIQETNKPSMKKVTYEIEEQLHDELKIKAIREKRTVSEIVNEIMKRELMN